MTASALWKDDRILAAGDFRAQVDDRLLQAAFFCNNARFADNEYKGDPTETALLRLGRERVGDLSAERIFEIPFDSDRKRMTTLNRTGDGEYVYTKGAMESILPSAADCSATASSWKWMRAFANRH
jgi:sodium/potassium-transporting ATPase subunit alpha